MDQNGYVDLIVIKEHLQGKHQDFKMFFQVFQEQIMHKEKLKGIDYCDITIRRYRLCLRYFKEMYAQVSKAEDISMKDVTRELIARFENFLKEERGISQNTMIRYMKCLKSIINMGLANGWMTVNHFGNIKYKEKKVVREFLTREEINILRNKEFDIPRLEMVRDIFLFCSLTGLAFIDMSTLKHCHIVEDAKGRKWIHKQRQNT